MKPLTWLTSLLTNFSYLFLGYILILFLSIHTLQGQHTISVRIDEAIVTTTCSDFLGNPDPLWQVSIEQEAWVTYGDATCHTTTPNTQFKTDVNCLHDLNGGEIEVCFKAFENDSGISTPCRINGECIETICKNIVLPLPGIDSSYVLALADGLSSGGELRFTVSTSGIITGAVNDHICYAVNLGTLENGNVLGKTELGTYNNYCTSAVNEANPRAVGGSFTNNVGTWFTFNTGDDPSELIIVEGLSDPEGTGDVVNLQLALYQSDADCMGNLTYITDHHDHRDLDEYMILECLPPNQEYYILVDAVFSAQVPDQLEGVYSIRISEATVVGDNEVICEAIPLPIAEGDTEIYTSFLNNCATNLNDPIVDTFPSFKPVWFQFTVPPSGRVELEVRSNLPFPAGIDPIEPQIAVYESADNTCAGDLTRIAHHYASDTPNNLLSLDCLEPEQSYWLMVDGSPENPTGVFDIHITDLGYPDLQQLDTTICEGSELVLGDQVYAATGTYLDTILFDDTCLEIIQTTLSIADSITIEMEVTKIAGGLDVSDGTVELTIAGGSGQYTILWSNGSDNQAEENLTGGEDYCVTVSDVVGCSRELCFTMPFIIPIEAHLDNDSLNCFGDNNGQLALTIDNGMPPYQYILQSPSSEILKTGTIETRQAELSFPDLKAGRYQLTVFTDNTVIEMTGRILEPRPIAIQVNIQEDASCHNICDAILDLQAIGGNGTFAFAWEDGIDRGTNANDLCAGNYQVTVIDKKQCTQTLDVTLSQPANFIAKAIQTNPVNCFGEENGQATITTSSGNPILYNWDNDATTATVNNLSAGEHSVIVTNDTGCKDTAFVEIEQPAMPITANIEVLATINCFGESSGLLEATAMGGNELYEYSWDNNTTSALNDNLAAGTYILTVSDQKGCTAISDFQLRQPELLDATITTQDITCPGGPRSGLLQIANTNGGIAPYGYSLDGSAFTTTQQFDRLTAAEYEIVVQDANGCEWAQTAMINDPPPLEVVLGEDQILKLGDFLQLEALSNREVNYEWESDNPLDCENCPTQQTQPLASGTYKVTVTDVVSECVASDEVFISIRNDREIFVPTAFSPNGDGQNDALLVYGGSDIQEIISFKIFDRKGALVYEADTFAPNDLANSWQGDFNGRALEPAVFIYWTEVLFIDGHREIYKGDVALMK